MVPPMKWTFRREDMTWERVQVRREAYRPKWANKKYQATMMTGSSQTYSLKSESPPVKDRVLKAMTKEAAITRASIVDAILENNLACSLSISPRPSEDQESRIELDSVHPETPDVTLVVSGSKRRHFLSWQGNQGIAR